MFRTMMVATGDSPWSRNAVDYALRLAENQRQTLLIAHVLDDGQIHHVPRSETADIELREQIETAGRDILQRAVQLAAQHQVEHRELMPWGDVSEEIVKAAVDAQCDLIVMGTRHLTGDKRLMTGRICNAVLATAPCPVLVVPFVQLG